jgi:muramoyltetrapeptide carboxypeptidase
VTSSGSRPPALRPGDRVALLSPSGPAVLARVEAAVAVLESWGLSVSRGAHALGRSGFFAGSDADRVADLCSAVLDPSVRAVMCTRGGYGAQRIVDAVPWESLRSSPKLVVGFSDITALHLAVWRRSGLASCLGPCLAWDPARIGADASDALRSALTDPSSPVVVERDPGEPTSVVSVPGVASGTVLGGNLSMLAATLGTPDFPDLSGAVLVLEDVGEAPYKVDRMLTQLRRARVLSEVAGVAVGQFTDCGSPDSALSVVEVLVDRLGDLGVPVLGGLPIGHGPGQRAVPLGVGGVLDVAAGTLVVDPGVC